jgi:hypothetical protein
MSVLDDYVVDPNVSLLSKTLIRGVALVSVLRTTTKLPCW